MQAPLPRGKRKGNAMTLAAIGYFERLIDRVAPAAFLALSLASFGAFALLGA